jgi:hypothetical protein
MHGTFLKMRSMSSSSSSLPENACRFFTWASEKFILAPLSWRQASFAAHQAFWRTNISLSLGRVSLERKASSSPSDRLGVLQGGGRVGPLGCDARDL